MKAFTVYYPIPTKITPYPLSFHFNHKIALGVKGRQETFKILIEKLRPNDRTLWFHCASNGHKILADGARSGRHC